MLPTILLIVHRLCHKSLQAPWSGPEPFPWGCLYSRGHLLVSGCQCGLPRLCEVCEVFPREETLEPRSGTAGGPAGGGEGGGERPRVSTGLSEG